MHREHFSEQLIMDSHHSSQNCSLSHNLRSNKELFKENEHELAINTITLEIWGFPIIRIARIWSNLLSNNNEGNNLPIAEVKLDGFCNQIGYNSKNSLPGFSDPNDHSQCLSSKSWFIYYDSTYLPKISWEG